MTPALVEPIGSIIVTESTSNASSLVHVPVQSQYIGFIVLGVLFLIVLLYFFFSRKKINVHTIAILLIFSLTFIPIVYAEGVNNPSSGKTGAGGGARITLLMNITIQELCGNSICGLGESCGSCSQDCGVCAGVSNQPSSGASTTGGGIFSGSQSGFSTAFMCNKTYDFLVLNKGNYTVNDLSALKLKIESLLGFSIQQSVLISYIDDYDAFCNNTLPSSNLSFIDMIQNPDTTFGITGKLFENGTFYGFTNKKWIDMNASIPMNQFTIAGMSDTATKLMGYIFTMEKITGSNSYIINGIRMYFVFVVLSIAVLLTGYFGYFIQRNIRIKRKKTYEINVYEKEKAET